MLGDGNTLIVHYRDQDKECIECKKCARICHMKAAAVVLMKGSLEKIPEIFALASKTMRVVRQNLFWAFFYSSIGIALAIAAILNPILAAGAMLFPASRWWSTR